MKILAITRTSILYALTLICVGSASADDVNILTASFQQQAQHQGGTQWSVSVTLRHNDTGWDHYADEWRIVDIDGQVFGNRVLLHPHIDEQPFTRSANGIIVPDDVSIVYIEAHDKIDGWMKSRLEVNLDQADNGHLIINGK
jgi:hypothetical protein